nr:hypothetical protein [Tanacetum cinerariifolium]
MTTPITTNATESQMHNNIMAAGLRDRPPMLVIGRYAQWQSRFMRYVDTSQMKEVNEIRAEKIARNANPLAFVAAAQQYLDTYHQAPKSHKSYAPTSKQSSFTISHTTTRHKGKEIAKPNTPPSESTSKEDSDLEQAQKDKDMQKNLHSVQMTVDGARETVRSQVVQQTRIQYFNYKEFKHFAKECRKPKRAKDYTYHKDKMLLCKQAEKGIPLQVKQSDWLVDTYEEIDE